MLSRSRTACATWSTSHQAPYALGETSLLQVPDQPLSCDTCHGIIRMMHTPLAVVAECVGQGIGDLAESARRSVADPVSPPRHQSRGDSLRLKLLNEEVLKPCPSRELLLQPLGFDPPAGPGLRSVLGVAVFRRDGSPSAFRHRLAARTPLRPARCGLSDPVDTDLKPRLAGHGLKFIKSGLDTFGKRHLGVLNQVAKLPVIQAIQIGF